MPAITARNGSHRAFTTFVRLITAVVILICFALGFGYSCRSSDDLSSLDLMSIPPGRWVSVFNGRNLEGWIQDPFNISDAVKVKAKSLQLAEGKPYSALSWTGNFPTEDYEMEVSAMRLSGRGYLLRYPVPGW